MRINGQNRLACKTKVRDLGENIEVIPLPGMRVAKDLIVDMEPFLAAYRSVKPYLINDNPAPERERLQSPEERKRFDDTTKCILCGACSGSCPVYWVNGIYLGPAALVQAHRFLFDSRDKGKGEHLKAVASPAGVWRCRDAYNCTDACPRDIPVTQAIDEIKRAVAMGEF